MAIKLIGIDIDGTLTNDHKEITPRTVDTIKKAAQNGIKIVICSGRPMPGVRPYVQQLGLDQSADEYVVAFNGGLAQATNDNVIVNYTLDFDDYAAIQDFAAEHHVKSVIETKDSIFTTNQDISRFAVSESNMTQMPLRYRTSDQLLDLRNQIVIGKFMMTDDPDKLNAAQASLPQSLADRFKIVRSEKYYLEFVNKQAGKGATLKALSQHLGIGQDEVMAIGNAQNDDSMIEFAGVGVAMGNSIPKTKEIANVVVADNNHDGVAEAIEKYA